MENKKPKRVKKDIIPDGKIKLGPIMKKKFD